MTRAELEIIIAVHHSDPKLVKAIIAVESEWNHNAVSKKGAIGLMQVMPSTAKGYGVERHELFNPEKNIETGCRILKDYQRTSKTLHIALIKYSGGAKNYYQKVLKKMREV
jgi:soluble lytic murein transglycosylase-like protein